MKAVIKGNINKNEGKNNNEGRNGKEDRLG